MSHYAQEKTIIQNEQNRDGYVVKVSSIKKINEDLKGYRLTIKKLTKGRSIRANLYYEWVPSKDQAKTLFGLICRTLQENLDRFGGECWDFGIHPINFIIKHRN